MCQIIVWMFLMFIGYAIVESQVARDLKEKQSTPTSGISQDGLNPESELVKRKIVQYHNSFRSKVKPTASNMLLMTWHPLAARKAQNYANKCIILKHNTHSENAVPLLGNCGQNIFAVSNKTTWLSAIESWFLEYKNFTYGAPVTNLKAVGHYTQMTWATSHKVGCGFASCKGGPWGHFYNYICHYCPTGNHQSKVQYPYKAGAKCADCPNHCQLGSLCTNSCPVVNTYSTYCDERALRQDFCSNGSCNATCICGNKQLYKNYPW